MLGQNDLMSNLPLSLTEDLAYELGKLDPNVFHPFYDMPTWLPSRDPAFRYAAFFNWGTPHCTGQSKRDPVSGADFDPNDYEWGWMFYGGLREDLFNTVALKHAYVRGQIDAQGGVGVTTISFNWANSLPTRDRVGRWLHDLIAASPSGVWCKWSLSKDEDYTIPICAHMTLTAEETVIRWLTTPLKPE